MHKILRMLRGGASRRMRTPQLSLERKGIIEELESDEDWELGNSLQMRENSKSWRPDRATISTLGACVWQVKLGP